MKKFIIPVTIGSVLIMTGIMLILTVGPGTDMGDVKNVKGTSVQKKLAKGFFALYNAEQEFLKTRNPVTGEIPDRIAAMEQKFSERLAKAMKFKSSQEWTNRGPFNVGGRMLCIAVDIEDESHLLAGSASGGMWQSKDGGQSWEKVTPANGEQSATCIVQDTRPGKTHIWY